MKKISLYLISLFTLATFSACNENFGDWAAPQTNEQETATNLSFTVANAELVYNLGIITTDSIEIARQTALSNEAGTIVSYDVQIDKAAEFTAKVVCPVTLSGNSFKMATSELQAAVEALSGKRPEARDLFLRVNAYVTTPAGQTSKAQSANLTIKATPKAPLIESAYYLVGNMNDWVDNDASKLIKLKNSGKDVYEDPVFSVVLEVSATCYWKVIPQSCVDALNAGTAENVWGPGVLGCAMNGDTSEEGKLITDNPQAMQIEDAGWVKITLNMMDYTYKVEALGTVSPYMYVVGDHQGWNPGTAPTVYSTDFISYSGFVSLNTGGFKVTSQRNWDGPNYGDGGNGKLSIAPDAGNLNVGQVGFYFLTANVASLTWSAASIETMGLIGDATAGGWDTSTAMDFNAATSEYTVTTTLVEGGFKFRANNGWDISLGGDVNNLTTANGANISVQAGSVIEPGKYEITLSLGDASQYKATLKKK